MKQGSLIPGQRAALEQFEGACPAGRGFLSTSCVEVSSVSVARYSADCSFSVTV